VKSTVEISGTAAIVAIEAEALDAHQAPAFRAQMRGWPPASGRLLLDLQRVTFIDSSGLGALLACQRMLEGAGGELKLCGLRPDVRAALELVRMDRLIDLYATREEALAAFRDTASTLPGRER
jgi:anti-sigma B factor antagonist